MSRRRYTKAQKATAVIAAEMSSMSAVSEQMGIPLATIDGWMDKPEFVELRNKTREDRAEAATSLSLRVLGEIERRLPEFEPRDLATLYGILTDKGQLLAGEATSRSEHRDLTADLQDHEKEALARILREAIAEKVV